MNPLKLDRVAQFVNSIKRASDPMAMMSSNPQMQEVMKMVQGKNPEEVFYQKCKEMNVDPNVILGMLR